MKWLEPAWGEKGLRAMRDMLNVDGELKRDMIQFLIDEGFWDSEKLTWDSAVARWTPV